MPTEKSRQNRKPHGFFTVFLPKRARIRRVGIFGRGGRKNATRRKTGRHKALRRVQADLPSKTTWQNAAIAGELNVTFLALEH